MKPYRLKRARFMRNLRHPVWCPRARRCHTMEKAHFLQRQRSWKQENRWNIPYGASFTGWKTVMWQN